jgi:hypothetical protein
VLCRTERNRKTEELTLTEKIGTEKKELAAAQECDDHDYRNGCAADPFDQG